MKMNQTYYKKLSKEQRDKNLYMTRLEKRRILEESNKRISNFKEMFLSSNGGAVNEHR